MTGLPALEAAGVFDADVAAVPSWLLLVELEE
jgi:hypothetical protein